MGDKKRKGGGDLAKRKRGNDDNKQKKKFKTTTDKRKKGHGGPHLPTRLRRELDTLNPSYRKKDEDIDSDEGNNLYEYEEGVPEEESKKNRRFDAVDNYEYELPDEFEDENVSSDDDLDYHTSGKIEAGTSDSDDADGEDGERHVRMLQDITGIPSEAFKGKQMKNDSIISEAYPESEFNPTGDILDGSGQISINDLLEPLQGKSGYSQLRKRIQQMERKSSPIQPPLPKVDQEKLERKVAYEYTKKDMTKWESLIKRNREAPTIIFDKDVNLGFSTVGAIAAEFEPRTEFEKKIDALVHDEKVVEAHKEDGSKLLELNKISPEDYRNYQNHVAKMRSLLFQHEMKTKRIKKIKSKAYHRLLTKDRLKAVSAVMELDPEEAKEQAMKQEFKRAEERMTLKHKNTSKWAKRIIQRGNLPHDDGTRAALSEQLHKNALLTRKMNSMKDSSSSSSDESDDEDDVDENSVISNSKVKVLERAKGKTLKILEEDDEGPNSGLLSLPFMVRGMKKRTEAAKEEAKLVLQEYETSLSQLDNVDMSKDSKPGAAGGRRVFGAAKHVPKANKKIEVDNDYGNSDRDDVDVDVDVIDEETMEVENSSKNILSKDGLSNLYSALDNKGSGIGHDSEVKFDHVVEDSDPRAPSEVAIFASGKWKRMKSGKEISTNVTGSSKVAAEPQNDYLEDQVKRRITVDIGSSKMPEPVYQNEELEQEGDSIETDSEVEMVDGILSSGMNSTYEIPSQADLIRHAFAGDDVEEEFAKDKEDILNEENPEPEKPVLLPGWGQWTRKQQKKGLPSWMRQEHENAKKKREEILKKRKDAKLKHVIISEKLDKKTEGLHTKTLPYPFTSKEVFEGSLRNPLGPEFNPATAVGALTRPEVVKRAGVIIKPIQYEDVDPYEKEGKTNDKNRKPKKNQKSKKKKKLQPRLTPVIAKS